MDRAAAEKEAVRLWRNLAVQDRLTRRQASAFAAMIAPTLDFDAPERRSKEIEAWLVRDLARSDSVITLSTTEDEDGHLRLAAPPWPQREGASAIALAIALLVMIARRLDLLANAMFWAEDGSVYFANAFNDGWLAPLFRTYGGYLQLVPRLIADITMLPPLRFAPLLTVWIALLVRAAIPAFIFSSRFNWIDWRAKVAIVAYFLLMPNLAEVHANITNTQWYLGLYLLAVILADTPRTRAWVVHDWAVLIAAGTTGPMVIFALPALVFRVMAQRTLPSARLSFAGVAAALAVLEIVLVTATALGAGSGAIDAGIFSIPQMLVSRVILGFITPIRWGGALSTLVIAVPALFLGLAITIAVLVRGDWRGRGIALVPILIVAAAIYTPMFSFGQTQWAPILGVAGDGYFVVAGVAWAATLILFSAIYLPRLSNEALAALVLVGGLLILFDFPLPQVAGPSFGAEAARVVAASAGDIVTVPIAPPGWDMELRAK